jgi:hypothetical protein
MTTTTGLVDGIIKKDSLGRMRTSRERREALLSEYDQSGMSGQKFAEWAGMKYSTFADWLQRRRDQRRKMKGTAKAEAPENTVRWLEAVVGSSTPKAAAALTPGSLIVEGPGGVRMEVNDRRQVSLAAQLLRELTGKPEC